MNNFTKYAFYYNLFYENKNYAGEAKVISNLIRSQKPEAVDVLDMGCGTGRHDIELSKLGYHMCGVDMSKNMISIAKKNARREQNSEIIYEVGDIRSYKTHQKFDVVLSLFHVISYQNSNQDLISAFHSIYNALKDGGICIFDVWYGPGVLREFPAVRVKRIKSENLKITRIAEPILHPRENIVDVNYEIQIQDTTSNLVETIKETHSMRYLFTPEIEYYLSQCGLKLIKCLDCNTLAETDFNSWTAYFIAVKKEEERL